MWGTSRACKFSTDPDLIFTSCVSAPDGGQIVDWELTQAAWLQDLSDRGPINLGSRRLCSPG